MDRLTLITYASLAGLLAMGWLRRPDSRILPILAANFAATAVIGEIMTRQPDRDAVMIFCDLATVYAIRACCSGARGLLVGVIGLGLIAARSAHMTDPYINQWGYSVVINAGFAAQLIAGGGFIDDYGHRISNWFARVCPRGASLLRHVAGA